MMKDKVFLTSTDTTVGFVSQNASKLDAIKQRPPHKKYIKAINSLSTLKEFTRVPSQHKNRVRRMKKTTFVMSDGNSYRIIQDKRHLLLIDRLKWAYTTSANISNHTYDEAFAKKSTDVIIEPLIYSDKSSTILKLGKKTIKRIR